MRVDVGFRYLSTEEREELRTIITHGKNLTIERFNSNVLTWSEAEELKQEAQMTTLVKVVRSGQVLKVQGDLLLIGDVNPGGTVMATGNIFVMGALKGIAHAGYNGNRQAVISASLMKPTQIRISDSIHQFQAAEDSEDALMCCAFLNEETSELVLERVQQLVRHRPSLNKND